MAKNEEILKNFLIVFVLFGFTGALIGGAIKSYILLEFFYEEPEITIIWILEITYLILVIFLGLFVGYSEKKKEMFYSVDGIFGAGKIENSDFRFISFPEDLKENSSNILDKSRAIIFPSSKEKDRRHYLSLKEKIPFLYLSILLVVIIKNYFFGLYSDVSQINVLLFDSFFIAIFLMIAYWLGEQKTVVDVMAYEEDNALKYGGPLSPPGERIFCKNMEEYSCLIPLSKIKKSNTFKRAKELYREYNL